MNKIINAVKWFLSGFHVTPFFLWTPRELDFGFQIGLAHYDEEYDFECPTYARIYLGPLTLGIDACQQIQERTVD